jgi:inner membrane protein
MTGRTHDLAAFTALGLVVSLYPIHTITLSTALFAITANMIGGIAPDIDQPTAPFWRNLPIGHILGKTFDSVIGGHRFLSHSLIGILLFGVGWHYFLQFLHPAIPTVDVVTVWWAFMIGVLSHLIMDTITKEGVPWLLPIPVKLGFPPIKLLRVQTGSFVEQFLVFPGLILANIYIYYTHYSKFLDILHHHLK